MSTGDDTSTIKAMLDAGRMAKLERTRIAYKGSITKRLNQLSELVQTGASRTKIRFLKKAMLDAFELQKGTCRELYGDDETQIIEEQARIDVVLCEIDDYLDARKDEASSRSSRISDWVKDYKIPNTVEEVPIYEDVESRENMVTIGQLENGAMYQNITNFEQNKDIRNLNKSSTRYNVDNNNTREMLHQRNPLNVEASQFHLQKQEMSRDDETNIGLFELHNENLKKNAGIPRKNEVGGDNLFVNTYGLPNRRRTLPKLPGKGTEWAVDAWIDDLDELRDEIGSEGREKSDHAIMALLMQQTLLRLDILKFDGRAEKWLEFVRKFHDLVHKEPFMSGIRKCALLFQHLEGEARRSVAGVPCDWAGYVISLKRIKFLFGETSKVISSVIRKITSGPTIRSENKGNLAQFLYDVSDCIISLKQLASPSDLYSHKVL